MGCYRSERKEAVVCPRKPPDLLVTNDSFDLYHSLDQSSTLKSCYPRRLSSSSTEGKLKYNRLHAYTPRHRNILSSCTIQVTSDVMLMSACVSCRARGRFAARVIRKLNENHEEELGNLKLQVLRENNCMLKKAA